MNEAKLKKWITYIVESKNKTISDIAYVFCSDEFSHKINLKYLKHDHYTDIITFNNSTKPNTIEADIVISIPRVKENAIKYKASFSNELHRVMIHGILHLLGLSDKSARKKAEMRKMEDKCLERLDSL